MANKPVTEKLFKKQLKVSPTFLQSVLKPPSNLPGHYIDVGPKDGYRDRLFQDSKFVFKSYANPDDDPGYLPSHKLRITSKKSRRRFDINVIFSYKKVPILPTHKIPEDAELIYETTYKITPGFQKKEGEPCAVDNECSSNICKNSKCWFPKDVDVVAPCPAGQTFAGTDPNTGQPICKGSPLDF